MSTTTPNFGWQVPTSTDYVKDGATAIETLGDAIDASLVDLKGGTTGQVLSKNSNTDMDFTWVTQDDANAIQNTIVDAKGDLISATAADTPARLAVGTNGQVLTADSSTATGLKWGSAGGSTVIDSGSFSGTSVTISSIASSYRDLRLVLRAVKPATDGDNINMQYNSDTGTNYYTTSQNAETGLTFTQTEITLMATADNTTQLGETIVNIYDYANTSSYKISEAISLERDEAANSYNYYRWMGFWESSSAIDAIKIFCASNMSGTYVLYGLS